MSNATAIFEYKVFYTSEEFVAWQLNEGKGKLIHNVMPVTYDILHSGSTFCKDNLTNVPYSETAGSSKASFGLFVLYTISAEEPKKEEV